MKPKAFFAWEGFSFFHPEDWAPVSLTGNRKEGYVRLEGSGRIGCQIRWKRAKDDARLDQALHDYFALLEKDSKRAKSTFKSEIQEVDGTLSYRWQGVLQGRGRLFWSAGRVIFLEVTGSRHDSLLPYAMELFESFATESSAEFEPWALFGMRVKLPKGLSPTKKLLQAGRTSLDFSLRGASIEVSRFGFGSQLIEKHGFEDWAKAALGMTKAVVTETRVGLHLKQKRSIVALVRFDERQNQITAIRVVTKQSKWIPEWDWLLSNES